MTLYEFLRKTKVDVRDNNCRLGNEVDSWLGHIGVYVDFDLEINMASEDILYQIGRISFIAQSGGKPYWKDEIITGMKKLISEYQC